MPTAARNMDTQLKYSVASGNATFASSSWLIIQVSSLQVPENLWLLLPLALFIPKLLGKQSNSKLELNCDFLSGALSQLTSYKPRRSKRWSEEARDEG